MEIRQQLVTSREKTWAGRNLCLTITVHETANTSRGANAAAHANLQSRGNVRDASWHYQVDDREIVQSFPDHVQCWHAGSSVGARQSIAIEICVNEDGDYAKALANAAWLVAHLREKHGLDRDRVVQHHHWTGKNCPTKLRAAGTWPTFVASTDRAPEPEPAPDLPQEADDMLLIRRLAAKNPLRKYALVSGGRAIEITRKTYTRLKKRTGQTATQPTTGDYDKIVRTWK